MLSPDIQSNPTIFFLTCQNNPTRWGLNMEADAVTLRGPRHSDYSKKGTAAFAVPFSVCNIRMTLCITSPAKPFHSKTGGSPPP